VLLVVAVLRLLPLLLWRRLLLVLLLSRLGLSLLLLVPAASVPRRGQ
jgi:hypothetical protein